jgi:hypothetical protein
MARFDIIPYAPEWDEQVRALCRIPVSGNIALALEREPNYLQGAFVQTDDPDIYLCIETAAKRVAGLFNMGSRDVYIHGKPTRARYWCDLRIHPDYQGSTALLRMMAFVTDSGKLNMEWPAQTIVFGDNTKMRDLIRRSKASKFQSRYPVYHPAGNYISHLLALGQTYAVDPHFRIRQANQADVAAMQAFINQHASKKQYAPVVKLHHLQTPVYRGQSIMGYWLAFDGDTLLGICGTWDQSEFKQTVVAGYSRTFQFIRPIYNLLSPVLRQPKMPPSGAKLPYLYLHTVCVTDNKPTIFENLIRHIANYYRKQTYAYLLYGCFEDDPLLGALSFFKRKRTILGKYYLVSHSLTPPFDLLNKPHALEASRI